MPGYDRKIDPATGDYVENEDGTEFELTTASSPAMYHQMRTRLNRWAGDYRAGATVDEITKGNVSADELADHRQQIAAALGQLEDEGYIANPRVEMSSERDRVGVETFSDDLNHGELPDDIYSEFED